MSIIIRASSEATSAAVTYEAGFIVLSYLISLVGCISALELLHRRTSVRGALNWYLLIAASITMGGVGIWSMHFVGNRAVILDHGAPDRQLLYNQGYTAISFFLPIVVLTIAFYLLAISGRATNLNIIIAGLLTGTAVCAMHYVGQVGIANYDCTYKTGNIVGAAIIAVVASLIALSIFFRLRENWTDSWWKRTFCAGLLAGAVSGMHWTAAVGTAYHYRTGGMRRGSRSRVQTVIFCAVLSIASCVFLLAIAFITHRRSLVHRRRAQELVLACAYFDEDDRVMVSHDGFLPYQKITNQFVRKTFGEDELNRSHPAFMWVYEASRNWPTLRELVPTIQDHLESDPVTKRYRPGHEDSIDLSRTASSDFNAIFKQLFCVAAERLANQIHEPLEELGVMFEEPLETGTTKSGRALQNRLTGFKDTDAEKRNTNKTFGKGRYLFMNRRLTKIEAADFAALGYRFGSITHVAESLARNMQVSHEVMLSRLERMKICISRAHLHPTGIHLACFLLRPNVYAGFDILVPTVSQNQLPLIKLPVAEITPSLQNLLQSIDERTVRDILKDLIPEESKIRNQEKDLRWQLYTAFVRLVDMVNDPETMMDARFSAKPVQAPCRSSEGSNTPSTCLLLSVRYLGSIHSTYTHKDLTYVPFDFFNAQQLVETSEARHRAFKRSAQLELCERLEHAHTKTESETKSILPQHNQQIIQQAESRHREPKRPDGFFSIFEFLRPKPLQNTSNSKAFFPGTSTRRSTQLSPNTSTPPRRKKKTLNVPTEEVREIQLVESTTPSPRQQKSTSLNKTSDEIELISLRDLKGTFVSDLFSLFRLSETASKAKARQDE